MSEQPRSRRLRPWLLVCVLGIVALAVAAQALFLAGDFPEKKPQQPVAGGKGSVQVSPPLATSGTGSANNGHASGHQAPGNPGSANHGGGNGQGTNGNGQGSGTGNDAPGKAIGATFVGATPVSPGTTGTMTLRVENPNQQDVLITGVTSTVTHVTTGSRPGIPSCDRSWFVIGGLSGTPRVPGRSSMTITVPVTMVDTAGVNQDNCKGITYSFTFTVNGRQA